MSKDTTSKIAEMSNDLSREVRGRIAEVQMRATRAIGAAPNNSEASAARSIYDDMCALRGQFYLVEGILKNLTDALASHELQLDFIEAGRE